ncbi:Sporulation regulator WhiA, C-terminal [uncultured Caudovirales phage]|uniref:Sporulation regulator WhiA, C-terminal n=1 Tax=uncultured Caudovirales phage TaxID=2100421 RepID=A0A6J5MSX6_9CAUD|nr:Sporulation regulator WhiA, C-terminal [uncultured Caudovirales phage]
MFEFSEAKCLEVNPEIFFADDEENPNEELVAVAKSICKGCPLLLACRTKAIDENLDGIWGGTTTRERRILVNRKVRNYVPVPRVFTTARRVALETANTSRISATAERDNVLFAEALKKFDDLDELTVTVLTLRVNNPDKSLAEISQMVSPPISRDIVSGRLRRIKKRVAQDG